VLAKNKLVKTVARPEISHTTGDHGFLWKVLWKLNMNLVSIILRGKLTEQQIPEFTQSETNTQGSTVW